MPNRWVDHVKKFAADNNLSYGCALSKPECKETYRAKYGVTKKLTKKQNIEMMGAEDFRSKMVATQDKKKKVLASLPKPKPEPEPEPEPKKKVSVKRFTHKGIEYFKNKDNVLYDTKTKEEIGIWDPVTETIDYYDDDDDEEDEEDVGEFSELEIKKWLNEKTIAGLDSGWQGIKDKLGNWFAYNKSPYQLTKLVRPNGEILDFAKDEIDLTEKEDKLYTKIFMVMNRERENYKGKNIINDDRELKRLLKYIDKTIK
jgi:hypothetical protein